MLRRGGEFNGQRIIAREVVDLRKGGDREKFTMSGMTFRPGYSHHNQWWILHNADGAFEASGINGQIAARQPGCGDDRGRVVVAPGRERRPDASAGARGVGCPSCGGPAVRQ